MKKMKNTMTITILLTLLLSGNLALALEVLDPAYKVETYATYASGPAPHRITCDAAGNFYAIYKSGGLVMKTDTNKNTTTLASGIVGIDDITWTGGTPYGDKLYLEMGDSYKVIQMDPVTGSWSNFSTSIFETPSCIGFDRTGNYGGKLYIGTGGQDHIYKIDTNGTRTMFTSWPGGGIGGSVQDLDIDLFGSLNSKMYVATEYPHDSDISGVFQIDTDGTVTRFNSDLAEAFNLQIDPVGTMFGGDMFVWGRTARDQPSYLYRINSTGQATIFSTGPVEWGYCFGIDGALYITDSDAGQVTISRVSLVPEPLSLVFLLSGGLLMGRKK